MVVDVGVDKSSYRSPKKTEVLDTLVSNPKGRQSPTYGGLADRLDMSLTASKPSVSPTKTVDSASRKGLFSRSQNIDSLNSERDVTEVSTNGPCVEKTVQEVKEECVNALSTDKSLSVKGPKKSDILVPYVPEVFEWKNRPITPPVPIVGEEIIQFRSANPEGSINR